MGVCASTSAACDSDYNDDNCHNPPLATPSKPSNLKSAQQIIQNIQDIRIEMPGPSGRHRVCVGQEPNASLVVSASWSKTGNAETVVLDLLAASSASFNPSVSLHADVDIGCLLFDKTGSFLHVIYHGCTTYGYNSCIKHCGDNIRQLNSQDAAAIESVTVDLAGVPETVHFVVFFLTSYAGHPLSSIRDGRAQVVLANPQSQHEIATLDWTRLAMKGDNLLALGETVSSPSEEEEGISSMLGVADANVAAIDSSLRITGMLVGMLFRAQSADMCRQAWYYDSHRFVKPGVRTHEQLIVPAQELMRQVQPHVRIQYGLELVVLRKGDVVRMDETLSDIMVGLGWNELSSVEGGPADLDASCLLCDSSGRVVDAVYFGRLKSNCHNVRHSGDNLTGVGAGDDERIHVRLTSLPNHIHNVVFTVTSYRGQQLAKMKGMFVRLVNQVTNRECVRYDVGDLSTSANAGETGVVLCRIQRCGPSNRSVWNMQALCVPIAGARMYRDCEACVSSLCRN